MRLNIDLLNEDREKLKLCPICGREVSIDIVENNETPDDVEVPDVPDISDDSIDEQSDIGDYDISISCECGIHFHTGTSNVDEFIKAWNTRTSREVIEKKVAKRTVVNLIRHKRHTWKVDKETGELDMYAYESGYHHGVCCEVCGAVKCVHCDEDYTVDEPCTQTYTYCPTCSILLPNDMELEKCNNCGQVLDSKNPIYENEHYKNLLED